ncbi:hypothetical protein SDC9_163819 [bioreactor metagenome]|uniref:Uncharacterized protein n=1 Tax=bioreactor metagenome TaxID=1076179 RepID=A0A645FPX6_9ZZZZ
MDAVGDVADRNFVERPARPEVFPHRTRHVAVKPAHGIAEIGQPQSQHRHRHTLAGIAFIDRDAPLEHAVDIDPGFAAKRSQIGPDQVEVEDFIPRRNRRVGGEDIAPPDDFQRGVHIVTVGLNQMRDARQRQKCRMTFVHMTHFRLIPHRHQRLVSADAEQQLLMNAVAHIAAVKPPGQNPQLRRILRNFGIEQNQRHIADFQHPDRGADHPVDQWK